MFYIDRVLFYVYSNVHQCNFYSTNNIETGLWDNFDLKE